MDKQWTPEQNARYERIINNIINNYLTHEDKLNLTKRDGKLQTLGKSYEQAKAANKVLTMNIIVRQIKSRTDEILCDYASRKISELINNGDIVFFLDDDQRQQFNTIRGRIFLLMDALDTAYLDMTNILDRNGIPGTVTMLSDIRNARRSIDRWAKDTVPVLRTQAKLLAAEESDHIYDYVSKRTDILNRKANRLLIKN